MNKEITHSRSRNISEVGLAPALTARVYVVKADHLSGGLSRDNQDGNSAFGFTRS